MVRTVFSCRALRSLRLLRLLFLVFIPFYVLEMLLLPFPAHSPNMMTQYKKTTSVASDQLSHNLLDLNATVSSEVKSGNVSGNSPKYNVCAMASGRLGNLMFTYASLVGIALRNNREPMFPAASALVQTFSTLSHLRDTDCKDYEIVYEDHYATYDLKFEKLPAANAFLMQYLQSWKYFYFVKDVILKEFTFRETIKNAASDMLALCMKGHEGKTKVGVHVRRGDRQRIVNGQKDYFMAPIEYVLKAMTYMREKHKNVFFIIVTDSFDWCKANFDNLTDVAITPDASEHVHLALLVSCDHVIMTVGTFGWWGGFLAGGDVYYVSLDPKVRSASRHDIIVHPEDHYLPHWIPLQM